MGISRYEPASKFLRLYNWNQSDYLNTLLTQLGLEEEVSSIAPLPFNATSHMPQSPMPFQLLVESLWTSYNLAPI